MKKKILSFLIISMFLTPFLAIQQVSATDVLGINYVQNNIALGNRDPRTMIADIINIVLTLLGIVAVIIVLLGGFKWMTAGGNEDKVSEAKKLLGAGVVGLVIILAAWGIANFILTQLAEQTGVGT